MKFHSEAMSKDKKNDGNTSMQEPDVVEHIPRQKLSKGLQKIVDREDDWMDSIYDGQYVWNLTDIEIQVLISL